MARWFNVGGPCNPAKNYTLSAMARLPEVVALIRKEQNFVVHAPRQYGKTTAFLSLVAGVLGWAMASLGAPALQLADGWRLKCDYRHAGTTNGWERAVPEGTVAAKMPYTTADADPGCQEVWLYREFVPNFAAGDLLLRNLCRFE